jgi:hypothetical protein
MRNGENEKIVDRSGFFAMGGWKIRLPDCRNIFLAFSPGWR